MILHLSNSLYYLHYCWPDLTKDSAGHMGKLNMWIKSVFFDILWKQQSLSPTKLCFLFILKGSRICHPQTCLFGIRIILGWLLLINTRHRRISENQIEVTLLKQTFTSLRDISICKVSPSLSRRGQWLNLQELSGEGNWLKSASPYPVYWALPAPAIASHI